MNHNKDEDWFNEYLKRFTTNSSHLDARKYPTRVRNTLRRYTETQSKLTIKYLSCQSNDSSAISVITIDKAITCHNLITDKSSENEIETSSLKNSASKFTTRKIKRERIV